MTVNATVGPVIRDAVSSIYGEVDQTPAAPVNVSPPAIMGPEYVGQTLTTTNGAWTGFPTPTYSYQWFRAPSTPIGTNSSSYTLVAADENENIFCRVTATNSEGSASADSGQTALIRVAIAPVQTTPPVIGPSGNQPSGTTLTYDTPGVWAGPPGSGEAGFTLDRFDWYRGGTIIPGTTGLTSYDTTGQPDGTYTVREQASNYAGGPVLGAPSNGISIGDVEQPIAPVGNVPAQSYTQYTFPTTLDMSSYFTSGAKYFYCDELPEGMDIMLKNGRVLGAPVEVQAARKCTVWAYNSDFSQAATQTFDLTVAAYTGTIRTPVDTTALLAVPEFATNYSGPGAIVQLAAGVSYDWDSISPLDRCVGLTSPLVFISSDLGNRSTLAGGSLRAVQFTANAGKSIGNLAFISVNLHRDQPDPIPSRPSLLGQNKDIVSLGGEDPSNIVFWDCDVTSDCPEPRTKVFAKSEMNGIYTNSSENRPPVNIAITNCRFKDLFNAVQIRGTNTLMKKLTIFDHWGDMVRPVPFGAETSQYMMIADCDFYDSISDGYVRHSDVVQAFGQGGGTGGDKRIHDLEIRGTLQFPGSKSYTQPPSIDSKYALKYLETTTSETVTGSDDLQLYRMQPIVAGAQLNLTLPAANSVANGFAVCAQKWDIGQAFGVTVIPDGSDTINGQGSNYTFTGDFMAVQFTSNGISAWNITIYQPGAQDFLMQANSLVEYKDVVIHGTLHHTVLFAGTSFQAPPSNVHILNQSMIADIPPDKNGDGVADIADGAGPSPSVASISHRAASGDMTVQNSVSGPQGFVGGSGTFDIINSVGTMNATQAPTVQALVQTSFDPQTKGQAIAFGRPVRGSAIDTIPAIGAVGHTVYGGYYDWHRRRPNIPGKARLNVGASTDGVGSVPRNAV